MPMNSQRYLIKFIIKRAKLSKVSLCLFSLIINIGNIIADTMSGESTTMSKGNFWNNMRKLSMPKRNAKTNRTSSVINTINRMKDIKSRNQNNKEDFTAASSFIEQSNSK
jgi:hypothetical protein